MKKNTYEQARHLAIMAHSGQFRKISKDPYILHPLRVSDRVHEYYHEHEDIELLRTIAILHDVIEDTWITKDYLKEKFGEEIAELVDLLSIPKGKSKKQMHEEYINKLRTAPDYVKIVKQADIYDNLVDIYDKAYDQEHRRTFEKHYANKAKKVLGVLKISDGVAKEPFNNMRNEINKRITKILS